MFRLAGCWETTSTAPRGCSGVSAGKSGFALRMGTVVSPLESVARRHRSGGEGRLFFVNVQYVADRIDALVAQYQPRVVALDLSRVPDLEYSALQALMEGEQRATERGAVLWLAALNPGVLEMVRHAGLADRLGPERLLFNARAVIERYKEMQATGRPAESNRGLMT